MSKTQFPLQVVGFDALYGLEILSLDETEATARVVVRDDVKQPAGLVHGGGGGVAVGKARGREGTVADGDGDGRLAS